MNTEQIAMQRLNELKRNSQMIGQQLESLKHQLMELDGVKESLSQLKKDEKGEILVPFGGGVFVRAKVENRNQVILNSGSSIAVEKDIDSVLELVEKQIKQLQEIEAQMNEEFLNISQQMDMMSLE
jgi:prefoldin alpha subunit